MTEVFLAGARAGDVAALRRHLGEDVVFVGDGGGQARTALRPIEGAHWVARLLVSLFERLGAELELRWVTANRHPALALVDGALLETLAWVLVDGARERGLCRARPGQARQPVRPPGDLRGARVATLGHSHAGCPPGLRGTDVPTRRT